MINWGDYDKNTTIHLSFNTVNQSGIGATILNSGIACLDNDTLNIIQGTGITLSGNVVGLTGIHIITLDLSNSGFIDGNTYSAYFLSGLVDTVNVANRIIGNFSVSRYVSTADINTQMDASLSAYGALKPTVVGRTLNISTGGYGDSNLVAISGTAQTAWDLKSTIDTVESGYGLQSALRLMLSSLAGKVSGADTTSVYIRDVNNRINRIIATCDASGNRTSITYDLSS